jgi:hypothetical protein
VPTPAWHDHGIIFFLMSLQRSAIKVIFTAERGELENEEIINIAYGVIAQLSPTERTALSSRGDRFHSTPNPDIFRKAGTAYLEQAQQGIEAAAAEQQQQQPGSTVGLQPEVSSAFQHDPTNSNSRRGSRFHPRSFTDVLLIPADGSDYFPVVNA